MTLAGLVALYLISTEALKRTATPARRAGAEDVTFQWPRIRGRVLLDSMRLVTPPNVSRSLPCP